MKSIFLKTMIAIAISGMALSTFALDDHFPGAVYARAGDIGLHESLPNELNEWVNPENGVFRINTFSGDEKDGDSQLYIVFADAVVAVGTPIDVKFDYRKDENSGVVKFNAEGHADPQVYVNNDGWKTLEAAEGWQTYEGSLVTTGEIRTLAVNASVGRDNGILYLRNIMVSVNHKDVVVTKKTDADNEVGYLKYYSDEYGFSYSDAEKKHLVGYHGDAKEITIPNSVTSIGLYAFDGYSLNSVTVYNSVTYIDLGAFNGVKNVVYSGNAEGAPWGALTVNGTIDGDFIYADAEKTLLTAYFGDGGDVVIPDGVVSIGSYAFEGCKGLKSVTIPKSVTIIRSCAFQGCGGDMTIYCESSSKPNDWENYWNCYDIWHGLFCTVMWAKDSNNSGTAVSEPTANKMSVYAHNNIIIVENATKEIRVYDAMGRIIGRDAINRVRTEIRVNTTGIYVVKVGNVAKRVMISD
ncbi:MAG: leucine-rich repeat domain-containing protein [Salinivirgaceae bacterium]|nr:leucine-rich repeat domain-containing protein [Salinivirgaceae bacterium]